MRDMSAETKAEWRQYVDAQRRFDELLNTYVSGRHYTEPVEPPESLTVQAVEEIEQSKVERDNALKRWPSLQPKRRPARSYYY